MDRYTLMIMVLALVAAVGVGAIAEYFYKKDRAKKPADWEYPPKKRS